MTEYYILHTTDNKIIETEKGDYYFTEDLYEAKKLAELLNCLVTKVPYIPKKKQPKQKTWKDYIK